MSRTLCDVRLYYEQHGGALHDAELLGWPDMLVLAGPTSGSDRMLHLPAYARALNEDVIVVALEGKSTIADYMVIATGRSHRQVGALAENLIRKIKTAKFGTPGVEGRPRGDWVLLDAGDVIVHLFRPEVRAFYNLEKMWAVELPGDEENTALPA